MAASLKKKAISHLVKLLLMPLRDRHDASAKTQACSSATESAGFGTSILLHRYWR
jgi:hypothetical protein